MIELRELTRENPHPREELLRIGITEETVAGLLRTTHRGWLCEEAGRIVGFTIGDGASGELWVIAVLPEFEGKGIGSPLLATLEAWMWSRGLQELRLWTSSNRELRAFGFYTKHSWTVSEEKDGVLYLRKRRPGNLPETGKNLSLADDKPMPTIGGVFTAPLVSLRTGLKVALFRGEATFKGGFEMGRLGWLGRMSFAQTARPRAKRGETTVTVNGTAHGSAFGKAVCRSCRALGLCFS